MPFLNFKDMFALAAESRPPGRKGSSLAKERGNQNITSFLGSSQLKTKKFHNTAENHQRIKESSPFENKNHQRGKRWKREGKGNESTKFECLKESNHLSVTGVEGFTVPPGLDVAPSASVQAEGGEGSQISAQLERFRQNHEFDMRQSHTITHCSPCSTNATLGKDFKGNVSTKIHCFRGGLEQLNS